MIGSPWNYFSLAELKCKCGECGSTGMEMNDGFMKKIVILREEFGFPFLVSSAYRCPKHNTSVSSTGIAGPHTTGRAMDIAVHGGEAYRLVKKAMLHDFSGIGISQKGMNRFIHLDNLEKPDYPRPNIWSY